MRKLLLVVLLIVGISLTFAAPKIKVGGKNFTEQFIVSNMIAKLLEEAGFNVELYTGMSSFAARKALETGQVDIYADYTGTAWVAYLKHKTVIQDPLKLYEAVKKEDFEKNRIVWLDMCGFNNTYALAVKREFAEKNGIKSISDLAKYEKNHDLIYGVDYEFFQRPDGFMKMAEVYGMSVKKNQVKTMEVGLTYEALYNGQIDVAMVFSTDGKLMKYNLVVLEDDKQFFPPYNLVPTVRKEVLDKYPQIRDIVRPLSLYLNQNIMIRLNYLVDVEGYEPPEVAEMFLKGLGLIK
ncbi:periplasmic glycine betaine/choline-binding (lipo)protein of an ABC-type transport system (osmoprotectant binding protein) [Fervidobacterium pennivorans DSM 9078]|uniref:Periplasmic glycine betaine/choline-binding (Lipo)protein of an ABC-type transport system (Osmoprotectant binding protein) n=1 Tax=Fervidobacterium pennivorans (strain DSM 9078 / Ven5) TaxID=771875 RepID=H9UCH0_FERPD|nr:glycine betaine ABC transporter substrate-binding protein [Fervidobacterium pennivorans]AFG35213.1 periplasmic glycine betaine/choline-binding (lipo)protein of an ABC-type transport system (osmoprotectant binding protein) [Fervidobacterium pennivorans DSM 9078]